VADVKTRYATGLQVSYDPGVWVVYAGFLLMIAGCYITFFRSHRQVYVEISQIEGTTRMQIFGITNKNRLGMERWLRRFGDRIASKK
jgi:cytochrome c biogenesis protein